MKSQKKKNFTVCLDPKLVEQAKLVADDQNRSLSNLIEIALQDKIKQLQK